MPTDELKDQPTEQAQFEGVEGQTSRRPYSRPSVRTVNLTNRNDTFGTNCFTSSNSQTNISLGCKVTPTPTCVS